MGAAAAEEEEEEEEGDISEVGRVKTLADPSDASGQTAAAAMADLSRDRIEKSPN